jgi:NADH:ubiquinone reductase (H+-translocating)
MGSRLPRVFIVGGGFAGIHAALALRKAPVDIILVDRRNHHLFQPLLYQVATAALSPADIATPIRRILRGQKNARVVLAEVTGIDVARKVIRIKGEELEFDYLILAAGATHSYFGHDDWASLAPGLKSLDDAVEIRKRILLAFESAEYEADPNRREAELTFAVVGGGPTGVELAGAIKEIAVNSIPRDFKYIDTTSARVVLLQGDDRVLPAFPPDLSAQALTDLTRMGVEVRLKSHVTGISKDGVNIGDEFLPVRTVFWAAGVKASPIAAGLGVPLDRAGRVVVGPDLSIPGNPEVFVVGDLAAAICSKTGKQVPGVAQGAMQGGDHVGRIIAAEVAAGSGDAPRPPPPRPPFVYRDKGNMATIGKNRAVAQIGKLHVTGLPAWVLWGCVHVMFLVGYRNRILVAMNWIWSWLLNSRDARLITGEARLDISKPRTP